MINKKYLTVFALSIIAAGLLLGNQALAAENNANTNSDYKFRDFKGDHKQQSKGIFATVSSISGNVITVTSENRGQKKDTTQTIYTVDATSATILKDGSTSSVSTITTGEKIMINGTINGTNITATKIIIGMPKNDGLGKLPQAVPQGDGQPILAGNVTAINGTSLTIINKNNVVYTIDATNAKITKENDSSKILTDVKVGDEIIVQGTINGTSITATSLIDNGSTTAKTDTKNHGGFFGGIINFFKQMFGF